MKEVMWEEIPSLFEIDIPKIRKIVGYYAFWGKVITSCLKPTLLKKEYLDENAKNPMFGHCYVASEAAYHLLCPTKTQPFYGKDERGITHWWLMDEKHNIRIDITCDQYYSQGLVPPYSAGVRSSFLTKEPSKRACIVMNDTIAKTLNMEVPNADF